MLLIEAHNNWKADIKPLVIKQYGENDEPALSESWNNYTDALCKDEELHDLQYHYAPAYDECEIFLEDTVTGELSFVLDHMGIEIDYKQLDTRPDNGHLDFSSDASHWEIELDNGSETVTIFYSMGSAHHGEPELADVIYCLLSDASCYVSVADFEDFCVEMGYTGLSQYKTAKRAYKGCKKAVKKLDKLLGGKVEDIRELFDHLGY